MDEAMRAGGYESADRGAVEAAIQEGLDELDRGDAIPEDRLDDYLNRLKAASDEGCDGNFGPLMDTDSHG